MRYFTCSVNAAIILSSFFYILVTCVIVSASNFFIFMYSWHIYCQNTCMNIWWYSVFNLYCSIFFKTIYALLRLLLDFWRLFLRSVLNFSRALYTSLLTSLFFHTAMNQNAALHLFLILLYLIFGAWYFFIAQNFLSFLINKIVLTIDNSYILQFIFDTYNRYYLISWHCKL